MDTTTSECESGPSPVAGGGGLETIFKAVQIKLHSCNNTVIASSLHCILPTSNGSLCVHCYRPCLH